MSNESFEAYYRKLYGSRWPVLRKALLETDAAVPFTGVDGAPALAAPYYLNRASVLAALSLRLPEPSGGGDDEPGIVFDACAAPGGKSLVLTSRIGADGVSGGLRLLSNELSRERGRRLSRTLDTHLPPELRALVETAAFDAAAMGGKKERRGRFAAVLLDAPCSSERHVLRDKKALSQWTPARPRFLARRQWALLSACFLMLKEGASLVYATCALSAEENDGAAGRLLEKYRGLVELDPPDFSEGEKTVYGRILLPDMADGLGPMYVARFWKMSGTKNPACPSSPRKV